MHRWWYGCLEPAGVVEKGQTRGRKMHAARYTAGTAFYLATGDIRATQQLLGHEDIASTASPPAPRAALVAAARFSPASRGTSTHDEEAARSISAALTSAVIVLRPDAQHGRRGRRGTVGGPGPTERGRPAAKEATPVAQLGASAIPARPVGLVQPDQPDGLRALDSWRRPADPRI
jgi:hypothetical protein